LGKTIALRFEIVRFLKKPALYALKTLNFKLTLPSLGQQVGDRISLTTGRGQGKTDNRLETGED
jgi:hypothetical protein